jgi:hypothetical protein
MANNFSLDPTCKALWRFESGALTDDSKGKNTLTAVNTPTADTTYYKEGASATALAAASHQFYKITQANLNSGFPWKYGESNLLGTVCLWVRATSLTGVIGLIGTPHSSAYNCVGLYLNGGQIYYQYNKSQVATGKTINVNNWWHIALVLDGVNKTIEVRVCKYGSSPSNYNGTNAATLTLGQDEWRVGALAGYDVTYTFQGSIDEAVVFSRLLSDGEIDAIRSGTFMEESSVNLSLATVEVVPLPMTVQLISQRRYPIPTDARGYGVQDKRRFPLIH